VAYYLADHLAPAMKPLRFKEKSLRATNDLGLMLLLLVAGSVLRLVWAADMEWKGDEIWMYETARQVADGRLPWPWLGMTSSAGLQNPGMSVWGFVALAYVAKTPVAMVRGVQLLNILALWLIFGFCYWRLAEKPQERGMWLWGIALAAVSPLAILFSRKIWAQDLLPIFCVVLLIGHWLRDRRWGAFAWGLGGAAIGQVHMSGFFLAAGLWLWTVYSDWRRGQLWQTRWISWLVGSGLGILPFIPWVLYAADASGSAARSWVGVLFPKFFIHWFNTSLGINLSYSLGRYFWSDFLLQPVIFGIPTYLVAIAHGILMGLGLWGLIQWLRSFRRPLSSLVRPVATPSVGGYGRSHGFFTGLVFTVFALNIPIHYLVVTFPMMYVWLASVFAKHHRFWLVIVGSQLFLAVAFLVFIHVTGGFADADYGIVYRLQADALPTPDYQ
jgi:hypothetical protein